MIHPLRRPPRSTRLRRPIGLVLLALTSVAAGFVVTPTASAAAAPAPPVNLIGNPGFESGTLSPWYAWNNSQVSSDSPRTGSYGLKIIAPPASAEQVVTVQPHTTYRLSGWLKSGAAGEAMVLGIKNNYGGPGEIATVTTATYTEAGVQFTTGASNTQVTVFCDKDTGTAPGYCDDLSLTPLSDWTTVAPVADSTSVVKNPAMGWQLYMESTSGAFPDAATFWSEVDPYRAVAGELYIRMPWSAFEPTEGHYAWQDDPNFIAIVDGARQRGLKLSFRIIEDSQDYTSQATPQFVFDDGAAKAPVLSDTGFPDPMLNDPVYRQKFTTFLQAFAARFNDPSVTDFVDTTGLGWWGEGNNVQLAGADVASTLTWATGLYASAFTRVLLNLSYGGGSFPVAAQDQVLADGFAIRRDSLGSAAYFPQSAQDAITAHFPATPVFGENCYQSFVLRPTTSCDGAIATDGLSTVLARVVADAENIHANTLDLRWPTTDLISWVRDNPGLVQDFARNGGYRLAPQQASYPTSTIAGAAVPIDTTWSNTGVGELPNDLHGWNQKYKVSYALLNPDGTVAAQYVDPNADPGTWIKGVPVTSTVPAVFNAPAGTYQLATAIVDTTQGNTPAINLALADTPTAAGWHPLGALTITPAYTAWSLKNVNSGLAVDDKDGSIAAGNPIIQYPYFGTSNQLWSFQDLGNGYEHVINTKSSMCLTVAGASQADGAGVVQLPCSTDTSQSWALQDVGNGSWRLQAAQSLKCLDVQNASTSSLAVLVQNACSLTSSQEWFRAGVQ